MTTTTRRIIISLVAALMLAAGTLTVGPVAHADDAAPTPTATATATPSAPPCTIPPNFLARFFSLEQANDKLFDTVLELRAQLEQANNRLARKQARIERLRARLRALR